MEKQWFVLHTLSGQEKKVKESIERRKKIEEVDDLVGDVLVPEEKVTETRRDRKTTVLKKFFPGYVLLNISLYDDQRAINERAWYFTQQTPGIIGFIGGDRPVPLRPAEIETILGQIEEKKDKVRPKITFEPGETVVITDGPFQNFNGVVEEVDAEHGKLKVSATIFGRPVPVELEYSQVERA